MKLLREFILVRALRRLLVGRADRVRLTYAVTVPAPRVKPAGNVVELRPHARADETSRSRPRHIQPDITGVRVGNR